MTRAQLKRAAKALLGCAAHAPQIPVWRSTQQQLSQYSLAD